VRTVRYFSKLLAWALLLPLYVLAFIVIGVLEAPGMALNAWGAGWRLLVRRG
jgi:hypothetical protein